MRDAPRVIRHAQNDDDGLRNTVKIAPVRLLKKEMTRRNTLLDQRPKVIRLS